jgi:hypothetical protein
MKNGRGVERFAVDFVKKFFGLIFISTFRTIKTPAHKK